MRQNNHSKPIQPQEQSYYVKKGPITYCVDYYVELLGVLYILCQDQEAVCEAGCIRCNEAYVQEVQAFFQAEAALPLTQTLAHLSDAYNFNYDAPVQLMLMISNQLPIDKQALMLDRKVIPDALFDSFVKQLLDFERSSNFSLFYKAHIPLYDTIIEGFARDYSLYNAHNYLAAFLQAPQDSQYFIHFMLGITNANYGAHFGNKIYACLRPYHKTRIPAFPDYSYEPIYYSTLILHEFAHAYVNPITAQYRSRIRSIDLHSHQKILSALFYGNSLETLINETIIRAIECKYVQEYFPAHYEAYVDAYQEEGYINIRAVISCLEPVPDMDRIISLFS